MYDAALLDAYCLSSDRWFESPARYVPTDEHVRAFRGAMPRDWTLERSGIWYVAHPPNHQIPDQGWKIHVSAATGESLQCLRLALPILRSKAATFKFLVDGAIADAVNGKLWARTSSGKFITVYPETDDLFLELGHALSKQLERSTSMYILSDRPWTGSGNVFYRFGAFKSNRSIRPDGTFQFNVVDPEGKLVPDERTPYWSPPKWTHDPLRTSETKSTPDTSVALESGRFVVSSALTFSNRGGVYGAIDTETGNEVVIKEARPGVTIGRHKVDAVGALCKEYLILRALEDTGSFVKPVRYFEEGGHAFLVEERVPGDHLGRFTIRRNPVYHGEIAHDKIREYIAQMVPIWDRVASAIRLAHSRGIVLGDLSFTNILLTDDHQPVLIDLECAIREHIDPPVGLHTPGMASPSALAYGTVDRENDYFALGSIMLGSIMLVSSFTELYPPAAERFIRELRDDLALPDRLVQLIRNLRLTAEEITIGTREIAGGSGRVQFPELRLREIDTSTDTRVPRLSVPPEIRLRSTSRKDLREQVHTAQDGIVRYIGQVADLSRRDRLVPGDLAVFETNPLSIAFGAAGVIHALHRIDPGNHQRLTDWLLKQPRDSFTLPPGLYTGQAGVAWVLNEVGYRDEALETIRMARRHALLWESPNILFGAAGFGLTALSLWRSGFGDELLQDAKSVGDHLHDTAEDAHRGAFWRSADGGVPIGYAFGGSGPALFLLYLYLATGESRHFDLGRLALDHELSHARWENDRLAGFPATSHLEHQDDDVARCYWDMGSAGVATTLLRYLAIRPDEHLEEWVDPLRQNMSQKYAVFPQLFHGLAGLGNVLLDVWQFRRDENALSDAWQVAEGLLLFGMERREGLAFPGEQAIRESGDLASGGAGIALFLHRLLAAEDSGSPSAIANSNFIVDELIDDWRIAGVNRTPSRPLPVRIT